MPITHKTRYEGQFFSSNGRIYLLKIYDKNYTGQTIPITIGGGGVKIKYDTKGQEKFSPIIASKCSISLVVENNVFGTHLKNFIKDLRETYEEGDATVVIWNTGSTSDTPLWSGNILIDLSSKEDVSRPYEVELNATDGLGLLRNYDMVSVQGSSPYVSADTYISDGYQTFIYWIKTILEYCNTPDSDSTDGDVSDYKFSTSIDWWYENHPAADPSVSPLAYTQCQMLGGYEVTEDGLYKVKSVYDVLESFCKIWGMRVVFWKNTFYFTQVELYNTADTGTFANPENIDSQIWNRNGTFSSSQDYLGNTHFSLYSQDIETNAGGFKGGLQKLAGSTWDYYPKLKEVSVDFTNISNNNYFTTFPQPTTDGDGTFPSTYWIDLILSTPLGVHSGAASFGGFNVLFILDFNNGAGGAIDWRNNATIRARPDGDTDWDSGYYFATATSTWETYPQESVSVDEDHVWVNMNNVINQGYNNIGNAFQDEPAVSMFTLPSGTSQHTVFSGQIPTNAAFTGDWEFEIFNLACVSGFSGWTPAYFWGHAGGDMAAGYYFNISVTHNVSYSDPLDVTGNPLSQFNPILGNVIGGSINTIVYSARSETQSQEVKDIWWGDTVTYGEPSSLIWTDGVSSGYTDPTGLWRNGQSGTFNKTITELLCEARLYFQQQSDYKWSLTTAVSETNRMINDGTGSRPVYINPLGRIHDTVDEIFYYLLRGTFNILLDEWEGEWLQVSYDDGISTTTTTTTTGGTSPTDNTSSARLSSPSSSRLDGFLTIGAIRTRIAAGTTITSVDIQIMNPLANEDEESPPLRIFDQTTLIKAGDIVNLSANGSNGQEGRFQQFEASADVEDGDNTMSVTSIKTTRALEVGDHISVNLRDSYQQLNHKTRGTINISEYSFTERSTDAAFPIEGNSVMWLSDGTATGDDGDMIITIQAGGVITTSKLDLTTIAATPFIFTVDTTASGSASDTFVLPLVDDGTISILVDWGDDSSDIISTYNQTEITHDYGAGGTYTIKLSGTIRGFRFADAGDKEKMRVVSQWGDLKITQTMAFKGCIDMTCSASDAPTILDITDLDSTFSTCTDLTNIGGAWDMAGITSLDSFFYQCSKFNQDISAWNVSSVTNFDELFFLNVLFNQDIGGWNTGAATTMVDMIDGNPSGAFDQDISSWDIADVTDFGTNFMREQTLSTANYDALLIAWDGQSVQSGLTLDFGNSIYTSGGTAAAARANLISSDSWTISDGGAAVAPFTFTVNTATSGASSSTQFQLPLVSSGSIDMDVDWGDGNTDTITAYNDAATLHTYSGSGVYTIQITNEVRGFKFAGSGDKNKINNISKWGEFNFTNTNSFQGCANLTSNATDTPTISSTDLSYTFWTASNFNGGTDNWDVSSVTNMSGMFGGAAAFNQDINSWNVSSVTNMYALFKNTAFNQDISSWNVSSVTNMSDTFNNCPFDQDISSWNVSSVTTMYSTFRNNTAFDQNIGSWNLGACTTMGVMFDGATSFNQDIGNWDTSKVTTMYGTFRNATSFDQDISDWDIAAVTALNIFIQYGTLSTANYDALLIGWNAQSVVSGLNADFGNSKYTGGADAAAARANLISSDSWTITDGGIA